MCIRDRLSNYQSTSFTLDYVVRRVLVIKVKVAGPPVLLTCNLPAAQKTTSKRSGKYLRADAYLAIMFQSRTYWPKPNTAHLFFNSQYLFFFLRVASVFFYASDGLGDTVRSWYLFEAGCVVNVLSLHSAHLMAVSYTHLDVYKRQLVIPSSAFQILNLVKIQNYKG